MFDGLFIASLIGSFIEAVKEACEPVVPAENWANKDLMYEDRMNGMTEEEIMDNVSNGKYKQTLVYPEPHRDVDGKIIIENCELYRNDLLMYGAIQTDKWLKQGKYNI